MELPKPPTSRASVSPTAAAPAPASAPLEDDAATGVASSVPVATTDEDDFLCIVCQDAPRGVRFHECGHAYSCALCTLKLIGHSSRMELKCPTCKESVLRIEDWGRDGPPTLEQQSAPHESHAMSAPHIVVAVLPRRAAIATRRIAAGV